ncbi:hypothetical protein FNH05_27915, partial [Amycolatopsis rhizosphaerae]
MPVRPTVTRQRPWGVAVVAALASVTLLAGACSSSPDSTAPPSIATGTAAAAAAAQVSIDGSGSTDFNPRTPIVVKVNGGKLTTVTVTNAAKGNAVKGALAADGSNWTSSEPLGYGTAYTVVAEAAGADGKPVEQKATVKTLT